MTLSLTNDHVEFIFILLVSCSSQYKTWPCKPVLSFSATVGDEKHPTFYRPKKIARFVPTCSLFDSDSSGVVLSHHPYRSL